MHIIYTRDRISPGQFDNLKYADFRRLFPETGAGKLPRPETLLREAPAPFLTAADIDIHLTVYPSGLYLYREPGEATVCAVSRCASFEYRSVTGNLILTEAETAELPWFIPLILVGSYRAEHNRDSRQDYAVAFHYNPDSIDALPACCHTPDFVQESDPLEDERRIRRKKYGALKAAFNDMTERQRQVTLLLGHDGLKVTEIADRLGVCKSDISKTIQRARNRMSKFL